MHFDMLPDLNRRSPEGEQDLYSCAFSSFAKQVCEHCLNYDGIEPIELLSGPQGGQHLLQVTPRGRLLPGAVEVRVRVLVPATRVELVTLRLIAECSTFELCKCVRTS